MSVKLGEAFLDVTPDTTSFSGKLTAQLQAAMRAIKKPEVPVDVNADAALATLKAKLASLNLATSALKLDADTKAITAKIAALELQVAQLEDALQNMTADVEIEAAQTKIIALIAQIKVLESESAKVKIDADVTALTAKLAAAQVAVETFGDTATKTATTTGTAWRGVWGILGARVPLFGGAATISGLHLIADGIVEIATVVAPAAIALAAFGIAASSTVNDIVKSETAMFTITTALGGTFPGLSSGLQKFTDSVKPEVYVLFGEALNTINDHTKVFQSLASGAGQALDNLGARAENALGGSGLNGLLARAGPDLQLLGDIIANVFGIFGNLLKTTVGFGEALFYTLRDITGAIEAITGSGFVQTLLTWGVGLHGAFIYAGLLVTGLLALRGPLVALGGMLLTATLNLIAYVGEILVADGAMATFAAIAAPLALINPFVWVAIAVAALVTLAVVLSRIETPAQRMYDAIIANVNAATTFTQAQVDLTQGLQQTNAALAKTPQYLTVTTMGMHGQITTVTELNTQYTGLTGNQQKLSDVQSTFSSRMAELVKVTGSQSTALADLNAIGVKAGSIATESAQAYQNQLTQIKALTNATTQLAGFTAGPAAAAQNAMTNLFLNEQLPAIQKITQAEQNLLNVVIGGEQSFVGFQQSVNQIGNDLGSAGAQLKGLSTSSSWASLNKAAGDLKVNISGLGKSQALTALKNAADAAYGSVGGLSQASLTLSSDFYNSVVPGAEKLVNSLQQQGISTKDLSTVTATAAGEMLKYAGNNDAARAVVMAFINNALGPATVSTQNLDKWVKQNSTSLDGMNNIVAQSTVKVGTLANVLNTQLVAAFQKSLFNASGAQGAIDAMTKAVTDQGTQSQAYKSARDQLINDLEKTGLNATDATTFVDGLTKSLGTLPANVTTTIHIDAAQAITDLNNFNSLVHAIGTVTVPIVAQVPGNVSASVGNVALGRAGGGLIGGHGGPTADDHLTRISTGEYVVQASAVNKYGVGVMNLINAGKFNLTDLAWSKSGPGKSYASAPAPVASNRRLSADALAIVAALEANTAAVMGQGPSMARALNSTSAASIARGSYSTRR